MKNGKKICEQLKQIRLDIARENGIEYTPCECNHKGDCAGTCPACDSELRYLEREISRKRFGLGKAAVRLPLIPGFNSQEDVQRSRQYLTSIGAIHFDEFTYQCIIQADKHQLQM